MHVPDLAPWQPPAILDRPIAPPPVDAPPPPKIAAPIPDHARQDIPRHPRHGLGPVGEVVESYCLHYNGGEFRRLCRAFASILADGGQIFLAMAGAFSTAECGKILAPLIRRGHIGGISCTGANLEEDVFRLVGHSRYIDLPGYQQLSRADDEALAESHNPRVTDSTIPEKYAMATVEGPVDKIWKRAKDEGRRIFPHDPLYELLNSGAFVDHYEKDPAESWLYAAAQRNLPIVVPGWGDSTLGQVFMASVYNGEYPDTLIKGDIAYGAEVLLPWIVRTMRDQSIPVGFLQLGGGIAGDYSICGVPCLIADAKVDVPYWAAFGQITDAEETCGGYSGAKPSEKETWLKITAKTPAAAVFGDYTTLLPFLVAYLLGW